MPRKLTPSDPKFWFILIWYNYHEHFREFLVHDAEYCEFSSIPLTAVDFTDTLKQLFPSFFPHTKRWLNGTELLSVWQYEKEHPELHDLVVDYIAKMDLQEP